jgi:hypothetical protein
MAEPVTLTTVLLAGGYMMADATVKEITKDAYSKLKATVGELFGRRAVQAAEKLERQETREEGEAELATLIPNLREEEAAELAPFVDALLSAMRADQAARATLAHAKIALDLDIGGNVLLDNIKGAREIGVRAKAVGDFTLKDVSMDPGAGSGN